jgi:hypothetical protein
VNAQKRASVSPGGLSFLKESNSSAGIELNPISSNPIETLEILLSWSLQQAALFFYFILMSEDQLLWIYQIEGDYCIPMKIGMFCDRQESSSTRLLF